MIGLDEQARLASVIGAALVANPADVARRNRALAEAGRRLGHWLTVRGQAVRLVGVVLLARLLTPTDYGTAGLAVTLASFS